MTRTGAEPSHRSQTRSSAISLAEEALAQEKAEMAELATKPLPVRWAGYARRTGPGWLQSAMTLGAGSASASLTMGALYGYDLLWVQPVGMILGVLMLSAVSYQTLSTQQRPFAAMKRYASPAIAWAWVIATLAATVIWHFPQYALAGGVTEDILKVAVDAIRGQPGWNPAGTSRTFLLLGIGVVILVFCTWITWNYSGARRGVRLYERAMKLMVWVIILSFAAVIVRGTMLGKVQWGKVLRGFFVPTIPTTPQGIETMMGALGACVGINMTFMYPYTLLRRGWGKEHSGLSRFDLITGMFLPFVLATSLMVIAAACTLYGTVPPGARVPPVEVAGRIADAGFGPTVGRVVFGVGILGMVLSSITTHMLVAGFAACEAFGLEPVGWKYNLCCLIPIPGVLGVVVWKYLGLYVGVRASAIAGLLLPIAYIAFLIMHNRRDYLGDDKPAGWRAAAWNVAMVLAIAATVAYILHFLYHNWNRIFSLS